VTVVQNFGLLPLAVMEKNCLAGTVVEHALDCASYIISADFKACGFVMEVVNVSVSQDVFNAKKNSFQLLVLINRTMDRSCEKMALHTTMNATAKLVSY